MDGLLEVFLLTLTIGAAAAQPMPSVPRSGQPMVQAATGDTYVPPALRAPVLTAEPAEIKVTRTAEAWSTLSR